MNFQDRTAVVTGGSRGIGLAIAKKLAEGGANIAILYVGDESEGLNAKAELEQYGTKVEQYFCNVADFAASKEVVDKVIADFGGIDYLINNAGITRDKLVLNMEESDFDAVINVNLKGTFNMIKHTYKHFMKKRFGRIVSTSSIVGLIGNAGQANYAASKAGIIGMTKSVARELAGRGVTVNAVAPGYIGTDMTNALSDKVKETMKAQIPAKRIGTPEDVANVVAFLCSDEAARLSAWTAVSRFKEGIMARRVVVTGLGAVSPVGNTVPEMWKNMVAGVNGIEEITAFDTSDLKVHIAGTVKGFQPELYFEKREAKKLDIYCQYAMAAAQQAVDDSGILGHIDENRFGVYIGAGIGGLNTFVSNTVGLELGGPRKVSPFFIPMMIGNIATGNVAIRFGAKGVSLSVMSACATGTNSIGEAFHAVKDGYADAIIAGGAEAVVARLTIAGFQNMKALSTNPDPSKASRPFDKDRDGFVMGEGAGMLILEEYEHAKARGAKIYAEFSGYGNTCDAHHVTAPDPEGAGLARAMNVADDANVYINAHGTSTHLNDLTETMAIKKALGEKAYDASISSTKSMTGHMLGATGAIEAIAAVKAIEEGVVPPTINLDEPDEGLDLDYTPKVAKKRDIDVAASTNLGFGGHDACVVFKKIAD